MPLPPIELTSFGYLHQPTGTDGQPVPPTADRTEDVRDRLRDPAAARNILDLDGRHPDVQAVVLATPGATELLDNLTAYALLPPDPAVSRSGAPAANTAHAHWSNSLPRASWSTASRSPSGTSTPTCPAS